MSTCSSYGPNDKLRYVHVLLLWRANEFIMLIYRAIGEGSWAGAWTTLKQPQWKVYSQHRCEVPHGNVIGAYFPNSSLCILSPH